MNIWIFIPLNSSGITMRNSCVFAILICGADKGDRPWAVKGRSWLYYWTWKDNNPVISAHAVKPQYNWIIDSHLVYEDYIVPGTTFGESRMLLCHFKRSPKETYKGLNTILMNIWSGTFAICYAFPSYNCCVMIRPSAQVRRAKVRQYMLSLPIIVNDCGTASSIAGVPNASVSTLAKLGQDTKPEYITGVIKHVRKRASSPMDIDRWRHLLLRLQKQWPSVRADK